jgi:hypothetical protein
VNEEALSHWRLSRQKQKYSFWIILIKEVGVRTVVLEEAKMEAKYSAEMLVSFHQSVVAAQKTVI